MAGTAGWRGRLLGGALLSLVVLGAGAAHVGWVRGTDGLLAQARPSEDLLSPPDAWGDADSRYRAKGHPVRTGTTELRVFPDKGEWTAEATHRLELHASDPMVEDLRTGNQTLDNWTPFMIQLGGAPDTCDTSVLTGTADDTSLAQETPASTVYATYVERTGWPGPESEYECPEGDATFTVDDIVDMLGKGGIYDSWTVTVDVPTRPLRTLKGGTVLRQDAHHAVLRLDKKGARLTVVLGPPDTRQTAGNSEQGDLEHLGVLLQKETPLREAFWLLVASSW